MKPELGADGSDLSGFPEVGGPFVAVAPNDRSGSISTDRASWRRVRFTSDNVQWGGAAAWHAGYK
jgi:hypothetical protein